MEQHTHPQNHAVGDAVGVGVGVDAGAGRTLRDRKRERTRQAIVEAGVGLFSRNGYDETTVADIAAAADIGTRTFFSYFASKEELLFPQSDVRVAAAVRAIAARASNDKPVEVLLRALADVGASDDDMVSELAALRLRLMATVPAVRGRSMQIQMAAEREIAGRLLEAFPDELDAVSAAALVGAFIGAVGSAIQLILADQDAAKAGPDRLRERLERAVAFALGACA